MQQPGAPPEKKTTSVAMIAVGIVVGAGVLCVVVGILSAIAIPAFIGYTRRSKAAEAQTNLRSLMRGEESYCRENRSLVTSAGPLPAVPTPSKQLVDCSSDPGFRALGFSLSDFVYYSYSIQPDPGVPGGARLSAQGDLDGDGRLSTFEVSCRPDCTCDSSPTVTNETE